MSRSSDRPQLGSSAKDSTSLLQLLSRLSATSVLGAKLPNPSRNRTSFAGQNHSHPRSRRPASSVSSGRITLAPLGVLAIVPLRSIEDGLLRRDSYDSLQTSHQLSAIQIATTKRNLASAQSIKAVFIRKMDFLLWTGLFQQHSRAVAQVLNQGLHRFLSSSTQADAPP